MAAEREKRVVYTATPSPDQNPTNESVRVRMAFKTTAALKVQPELTLEVTSAEEPDHLFLESIARLSGQALGITTLLRERWEAQLAAGGRSDHPEPLIDENEEIGEWLIKRGGGVE